MKAHIDSGLLRSSFLESKKSGVHLLTPQSEVDTEMDTEMDRGIEDTEIDTEIDTEMGIAKKARVDLQTLHTEMDTGIEDTEIDIAKS